MFEKESIALPSPPTWEMMNTDLSAALTSDFIFSLPDQTKNSGDSNNDQDDDPEKIFITARNLRNQQMKLDETVKIVKDEKEKLAAAVKELKNTIDKVKEEASQIKG